MNARQLKFTSEYIKTGNATDSAIKAGYSQKTARSIANKLLTKADIKQKIKDSLEKIEKQSCLTVSDIVKEIYSIALGAKSETNRLRAYDMLMKHLGGYMPELERLSEEQLDFIIKKLKNER